MPSNKVMLGTAAAGATSAAVVLWRSLYPQLSYDLDMMKKINKVSSVVEKCVVQNKFLIDLFEENVARNPTKACMIHEDRIYSYEYVDKMANKIANIALTWGLDPNDTVATMIQNDPSFIWTMLGLQKAGLADAFVNYHLTNKPLVHSFKVSECKVIIIGKGDDMLQAVLEVQEELPDIPVFVMGKSQKELPERFISFDDIFLRALPVPVCRETRAHFDVLTPMCFMYTSGTTGLPKPAILNQIRVLGASHLYNLIDYTEDDVVYIVTPMYHSAATSLCVFNSLRAGSTMVIRNKFSASHFWGDVRRYDVTVIQYIGELCRYLLKTPESPLDGVHKVRIAYGNGLRPDIWREFKTRFKIPVIGEFFGATEGPAHFCNLDNKVGACGRLSPILQWGCTAGPASVRLIKYDPIEDVPIRDKNGRCCIIKPGEEGLLIGIIPPQYTRFYKGSDEMNEKKFIRNAFTEGDSYFNFGDIFTIDKDYYLYFRDRVGDTFRWKGENVSTREVGDVISEMDFIDDVNVYGVRIPGTDGRAGMAAILLHKGRKVTEDMLRTFYKKCCHDLPSYAVPIFLRFQGNLTVTQTLKHRKVELVKEGFDPSIVSDPLYVIDKLNETYAPLTQTNMGQVITSRL